MRCRIPTLLLTALLAAGLGACEDRSEQVLDVTVIGSDAPSLADPAGAALSTPDEVMLLNAAQGLVRFDARGQIEPGLAERWNISDDGLSYIFRLSGEWPNGDSISAREVARILNRQRRSASRNPLKDTLGAIDEIVAMTDRVIEVRLSAPRPNLLQLLAQPELAIVRDRRGTGPFRIDEAQPMPGAIAMTKRTEVIDAKDLIERARLRHAKAADAIEQFRQGETALVLGGTFADLPLVGRGSRGRDRLRFDPVAGLFGLAPARRGGPLADEELREALNKAIDREALIAALGVPSLLPRTTLLQAELEGGATPVPPEWAGVPMEDRRAAAIGEARDAIDSEEPIKLAIALPEGPGADIVFDRLVSDWRPLGIELVRAGKGVPADLKLVDKVAPSSSPAWFVRSFRCGVAPLCSEDADELMELARSTTIGAQRAAMLAEAGRLIDEEDLFLPIAAPVRWSLVADGLPGFAENIFARHPLSGLRERPTRERQ